MGVASVRTYVRTYAGKLQIKFAEQDKISSKGKAIRAVARLHRRGKSCEKNVNDLFSNCPILFVFFISEFIETSVGKFRV